MSRLCITVSATGVLVGDRIELAESFGARLKGLMFRSRLAPGEGLLLRSVDAIHMCFMRFAIDAVFLDSEGCVMKVCARVRPWIGTASADRAADVLELPAGRAAACGITEGVTLVMESTETGG